METGFPIVMILGPLVAAGAAFAVGARRRAATLVGLISLGLLALLLLLATPGTGLFADNTLGLFGRELLLTPAIRSLFLIIYPALGLLLLLNWFRPGGRVLIPISLAALSPLAAALMISPAGLGAVMVVAASAVVVPALHGGRFRAATAVWRYFALMALALGTALLVLSDPSGGANGWLWALLMALVWLGGFPFHVWVNGLGRHAPLGALTFLLGLVQLVIVVFLLNALDAQPAVRASVEFQAAVRWSAALAALVAAFQISRAADWRELLSGLLVLDMGLLPLAVLSPGTDGMMIALPAVVARFLSLLLVAAAFPVGSGVAEGGRAARLWGLLRPAMLLYAGLSLVGLPLTPGFAGRWQQLLAAGEGGLWPPLLIVPAMGVTLFALLRGARGSVANEPDRRSTPAPQPVTRAERVYHLVLLVIAGLAGLFPGLLLGLAARVVGLA